MGFPNSVAVYGVSGLISNSNCAIPLPVVKRKIIYIDMDGVLVDLEGNIRKMKTQETLYTTSNDLIPGVFRDPPSIPGAINAVNTLTSDPRFDVYIATSSPWNNPESASDKIWWIRKHFGDSLKKRIVITHNKNLLIGDYLIDDRTANGAGEFTGKHIHFGTEEFKNWDSVLNFLLNSVTCQEYSQSDLSSEV